MSVHIIVDGYNLIGCDKGLTGNLESKRNRLVQQLRQYHEAKDYPITVVFDGWRSGWVYQVEEKAGAIKVIYSQQGEKADSVIQRLARNMGSGCVVVTSDRELRQAVEASGAVAVYAGEFGAKLRNVDREIYLKAEDFEVDRELPAAREQPKKGNPRRLSKIERRRRERLKKL
ncbi:MAG: NYN domain-containing protein [Deltaproteobacteria bacterium]|nr:NYN domain-containing protein [Deltaproteobacteria bacterium]